MTKFEKKCVKKCNQVKCCLKKQHIGTDHNSDCDYVISFYYNTSVQTGI